MARRAGGARKTAVKPAATGDVTERLIDAALALAAREGWHRMSIAEIATKAGLSLAEAHAVGASKPAILRAWQRRIDRTVLAQAGDGGEPPRDRLFDVLMRRFEALQPYRPALRAILRDPAGVCSLPNLVSSMAWMLEAAGVRSIGGRGCARAVVLSGLYLSVLRTFLDDHTSDLAATMATLDRQLRRAGVWLGLQDRPGDGRQAAV
jgi:AcrR family transcriptional regulator